MKNSIRLSPKHGVNPTIPRCFYCGKEKNQLLVLGRLPGDAEAPRGAVFDKEPCEECQDYMQQGVILISVKDGAFDNGPTDEPYRTGCWAVVTEEAIKRVVQPPELLSRILQKRVCFLEDKMWDMLGLPRGEQDASQG